MRHHSITTVLLVACATLVLAATATAQPERGLGRGHGHGFDADRGPERGLRLERLARHLELSDEQQAAIGKILQESRAKHVETRKAMLRLRNALEGELLADEPDEKAALELTQQMGDLRTAMRQDRLRTRLSVREQLTPEQRDKMLMLRDGRHGRGGRGPGHGPGRGDCHGPCRDHGGRRAWSGDDD